MIKASLEEYSKIMLNHAAARKITGDVFSSKEFYLVSKIMDRSIKRIEELEAEVNDYISDAKGV